MAPYILTSDNGRITLEVNGAHGWVTDGDRTLFFNRVTAPKTGAPRGWDILVNGTFVHRETLNEVHAFFVITK